MTELQNLRDRVEKLEAALKYYSREYNYTERKHTFALNGPNGGRGYNFVKPVIKDGGKRARRALAARKKSD